MKSGINGRESREPGLNNTLAGHEMYHMDLFTNDQILQRLNLFDSIYERCWRGSCHYAHCVVIVAQSVVGLVDAERQVHIGKIWTIVLTDASRLLR